MSPLFIYQGHVEVYFGSKVPAGQSPFQPNADVIITATADLTNLGTVLSVGDVNGDSHPDLLIGNPYARGDPALGQSGN